MNKTTKLKFSHAYCVETDCLVTPVQARYLHFDEQGKHYGRKFSFLCEDPVCRVRMDSANIYKVLPPKVAMYFRTARLVQHNDQCSFRQDSSDPRRHIDALGRERSRINRDIIFDLNPSVRLLGSRAIIGDVTETDTIPADNRGHHGFPHNNATRPLHYSTLEFVVDEWLRSDDEQKRSRNITIGTKRLSLRSMFKKVQYFQDGQGLIYWGPVGQLKQYGKHFSIYFKHRAKFGDRNLPIGIYLKDEQIEGYRRRKMLRAQLEEMAHTEETIFCFFVGTYPYFQEYPHNGEMRQKLNVDIVDLDHLVLMKDGGNLTKT